MPVVLGVQFIGRPPGGACVSRSEAPPASHPATGRWKKVHSHRSRRDPSSQLLQGNTQQQLFLSSRIHIARVNPWLKAWIFVTEFKEMRLFGSYGNVGFFGFFVERLSIKLYGRCKKVIWMHWMYWIKMGLSFQKFCIHMQKLTIGNAKYFPSTSRLEMSSMWVFMQGIN